MALTLEQLQLASLAVGQYKLQVAETIKTCEKVMNVVDLRVELLDVLKLEKQLGQELFEARQLSLPVTL